MSLILLERGYALSPLVPSDAPLLRDHLQEPLMHRYTSALPHPYTLAHAQDWITYVTQETQQARRVLNFAIRAPEGQLIGGIGLRDLGADHTPRAEVGYWLAKPYWGQGIMTGALSALCHTGFREYGLVRIWAMIFAPNLASGRVLKKVGFQEEGYLRQHQFKAGQLWDQRIYGLLPRDLIYPSR